MRAMCSLKWPPSYQHGYGCTSSNGHTAGIAQTHLPGQACGGRCACWGRLLGKAHMVKCCCIVKVKSAPCQTDQSARAARSTGAAWSDCRVRVPPSAHISAPVVIGPPGPHPAGKAVAPGRRIRPGTRFASPTSVAGLGSPQPHLRRDSVWTRLALLPHLHRDRAHPQPHLRRDSARPSAASAP